MSFLSQLYPYLVVKTSVREFKVLPKIFGINTVSYAPKENVIFQTKMSTQSQSAHIKVMQSGHSKSGFVASKSKQKLKYFRRMSFQIQDP